MVSRELARMPQSLSGNTTEMDKQNCELRTREFRFVLDSDIVQEHLRIKESRVTLGLGLLTARSFSVYLTPSLEIPRRIGYWTCPVSTSAVKYDDVVGLSQTGLSQIIHSQVGP